MCGQMIVNQSLGLKASKVVGEIFSREIQDDLERLHAQLAIFGWYASADNNMHVELFPQAAVIALEIAELGTEDLEQLCKKNQDLIRRQMKRESTEGKPQVMIVSDHEHMLRYHKKEEFTWEKSFERKTSG